MTEDEKPHVDIWRDTLLRYCGYANEVGESFRHVAPALYYPSYGVAIAYVLGDVQDKARKTYAIEKKLTLSTAISSVDCFAWQMLASVMVPGFTIGMTVNATSTLLKKTIKNTKIIRWAPVAVGLGLIPFIVHPIDHGVTVAMDSTVRKLYPVPEEDKS